MRTSLLALLLAPVLAWGESASDPAGAYAALAALGGEEPFAASAPAAWRLAGRDGRPPEGLAETVAVAGQPFTQALRLHVAGSPAKPFDLQLMAEERNRLPVRQGDTVLLAAALRCLDSADESGDGSVQVWCNAGSEWISPATAVANREWTVTWGRFTATRDYAAGELRLLLHASPRRQVVELGPLHWRNLGRVADPGRLPRNQATYEGRAADAPWRAAAEERIRILRMGDLAVRVVDAAGRPVAGARVEAELVRHAYRFGCYVEFPADPRQRTRWQERFLALFNAATLPMFWGPGDRDGRPGWGWASERGRAEYRAMAEWAAANRLALSGHTILYERWDLMPAAVRAAAGDPARLRALVDARIAEVVGANRALGMHSWQVVNEHLISSVLADALDGDREVARWFRLAQAADPGARLLVNDNAILSSPSNQVKHERYEAQVRGLLAAGAPIGGIGFQAHMGARPTGIPRLLALLDRFAALGLPLEATEFTMHGDDEALQADYTRDFYTAFFSHPATDGITTWGLWAGRHYNPSLAPVAQDWEERPNGAAYRALVHDRWRTRVAVDTGADGAAALRGFKGDYRITVRAGARTAVAACAIGSLPAVCEVGLPDGAR